MTEGGGTVSLREIILGSLICGLGLGVPWVMHQVGGGNLGPVFLPMFLPILTGAFFLSPMGAAFVGVVTPMLSSLTGMPPLPIALVMAVEMGTAGLVISLLWRRTSHVVLTEGSWFRRHRRVLAVLAAGIAADRAIVFFMVVGLADLFGLPAQMFGWGSAIAGIPGIAVQLTVIPPVVARLLGARRENVQ
jgi:hypothetical protein